LKQSLKNCKRIVVKIGSSLLYSRQGEINSVFISDIASQISDIFKEGKEVIIVSSGAIAFGMHILKLDSRPKELSYLQAAAAIGQHELMDAYRDAFRSKNLTCAQLLLTWEDFNDRRRYLNAKNTLSTLFRLKSVPIINENDTVSTDEIKFGDNDRLSAMVASLVSADLLIILSDVDGLWDKDKKVIRVVEQINSEIRALACPSSRKTCVGGMITKIEAAKIAVDSGVLCVIANGSQSSVIQKLTNDPYSTGTIFLSKNSLIARHRWIAFATKAKGKIMVDDGAKKALASGRSLLAVGVTSVSGNFIKGDTVSVLDSAKNEFARGKINISSKQLSISLGKRREKEVIHRDNLVIL
jgi:glutamate 5-kinase